MSPENFFSFCTSLKPIELKALGELSHVEHLPEGAIIYSKGDPSDALYIISRGVVEVLYDEVQTHPVDNISAYLSRGDMFGTVGVMTDSPRANAIRTCEPVSMQCFQKQDLPEILRRVPAFYQYIAVQLAYQLMQINEAAFIQSNCIELSGSLANFDLVTVFQTILQSSQSGELIVCASNGDPIAKFYFGNGQPLYGQFGHLLGQEALWQLFLRDLPGTFSFQILENPTDTTGPLPAERGSNDLLINALRLRDEFTLLKEILPGENCTFIRVKNELEWNGNPELTDIVTAIWNLCCKCQPRTDTLFEALHFSELTLYRGIQELIQSGHIVASEVVNTPDTTPPVQGPTHPRAIPNTKRIQFRTPMPV